MHLSPWLRYCSYLIDNHRPGDPVNNQDSLKWRCLTDQLTGSQISFLSSQLPGRCNQWTIAAGLTKRYYSQPWIWLGLSLKTISGRKKLIMFSFFLNTFLHPQVYPSNVLKISSKSTLSILSIFLFIIYIYQINIPKSPRRTRKRSQ